MEKLNFPVPQYGDSPEKNRVTVIDSKDVAQWYSPVLVTAGMIGEKSCEKKVLKRVVELFRLIEPDDYVNALLEFFTQGLERFDSRWRYSDIVTVLFAAAKLLKPETYLEIGVRRGRSMAAVAKVQPECTIVGFDYWKRNYAGMITPGPEFVEAELKKIGYRGTLNLVSGNSHQTVPQFMADHPDEYFDLITVDGDHSPEGAADDLKNVLPRLKVGGAVIFDDICHPAHPELGAVWDFYVNDAERFSTWNYTDLGYGVGIAVRKK